MPITIPDGLVEAVLQKRCVLFGGAGLSRADVSEEEGSVEQYLPTWGGLLIALLQSAVDSGTLNSREASRLRTAAKEGKYLFVAEAVRSILGEREFDNSLERIFRDQRLKPTRRHRLITQIPFLAVITTNYDKLLETAYASSNYIPAVYTFQDAPDVISALAHGKFFILKAHGDIDRKNSLILSERQYRDVIYRQPGYRAALNTIFIKETVVFVGASLSDPDVKLVLESVSESFGGKGATHYALVPWKEAADAEVRHWRDFFGIHLIRYRATKGHPEVDAFLEQLRDRISGA